MTKMDVAAFQAVRKVSEWHGITVPDEMPDDIPDMLTGKYGFFIGLAICVGAGAYLAFARRRREDDEGYDPDDPRILK